MSRKLLRDGDIWTGSRRISRRVKVGEGDKAIPKSGIIFARWEEQWWWPESPTEAGAIGGGKWQGMCSILRAWIMMLESLGFVQKEQDTTALILADTCGSSWKAWIGWAISWGQEDQLCQLLQQSRQKRRGRRGIMVSVGTIAGRERQLSDLQAEEEREQTRAGYKSQYSTNPHTWVWPEYGFCCVFLIPLFYWVLY